MFPTDTGEDWGEATHYQLKGIKVSHSYLSFIDVTLAETLKYLIIVSLGWKSRFQTPFPGRLELEVTVFPMTFGWSKLSLDCRPFWSFD
jgi:hypothetical protein